MLEKAGYIGDGSEYSNLIAKEIQTKNTLIDTLIDKMMDKEDWYYSRFSIMESALSDMQSQSSWLGNQFNM
ncbi:MAG: flagellar capping protein [Firmicutes bacterium ADurb.Bin419]|nr:MAG: flagellar capping protein [Firmicutes bacterium ADurb.Bin419]